MLPEGRRLDEALVAHASPAEFSRRYFGWSPYPYQEQVMDAILLEGARRVAWVAGRRVGKTDTIANVALQRAIRHAPSQIAVIAPTLSQASILSRRVRYFLWGSPFRSHVVHDNVSELRLRFGFDARGKPVESVIFAKSLTGQVRGEGADMLIMDESAYCDSADYRNKAYPYVGDRPDGVIIHISTVKQKDDHFWEALQTWGPPKGRVFRTKTSERPGVTAEMLAEWQQGMLRSEYLREYECELIAEGEVFPREAVAACLDRYEVPGLARLASVQPRRHCAYYVGVDWAKMKDQSVIAVVEHGTQERVNPARLVFLQVYPPDPTGDRHYARVIEDVLRVAQHFGAARVVADASARDASERLQRVLGKRFEAFTFTAGSRDGLVDNALHIVEKRGLRIPLEPAIVREAFANVQTGEKGYEHASRRTKDVFDAIALALSEATTAGEVERRRSMQLHSVAPGSAPIGLGGYQKMGNVVPDPLYWASNEMRRYIRGRP